MNENPRHIQHQNAIAERRINDCRSQIRKDLGKDLCCRYTWRNYNVENAEQRVVYNRIGNIARRITEFVIKDRMGCVFFGNYGTGKDHLAACLLKTAAREGISARWFQASKLYERLSEARRGIGSQSFSAVLREIESADVICLSDPRFDRNWSESKQEYLAEIVRGRADRKRPTWITTNLQAWEHESAWKSFHPDVWRRLNERVVALKFDWETKSYGSCGY